MFEVYRFSQIEISAFILVLVRISVFLATWPVFGQGTVPGPVKILFGLVTSLAVFPLVGWRQLGAGDIDQYLLWLAGKEALAGLMLGFFVRLFFAAIEIGGQMVTDAIGFGSAQIFNPTFQSQTSVVQEFYIILTSLIYLALNGHHLFFSGIIESFNLLPLGMESLSMAPFKDIGGVIHNIFEIGIRIAAPVMVAVFLTNIAMAVVGRAVPQINIFVTSLSVNTMVGLLVMMVSIPLFLTGIHQILDLSLDRFFGLMKGL